MEYDGTPLNGWQFQEGLPTAEGHIREAIYKFCQENPEIHASGRTDAGVHARGQVIHFDLSDEIAQREPYSILRGINFYLLETPVMLLDVTPVSENFHARFSSTQRHYRYLVVNRTAPVRLEFNRAWHVPQKLDVGAMQAALPHFLGLHDFTSFRSTECQAQSAMKTVDYFTLRAEEHMLVFEVGSRSFLHHQVRNMVGTVAEVGVGRRAPEDIVSILHAKDRRAAGQTAPAHGLYFMRVEY